MSSINSFSSVPYPYAPQRSFSGTTSANIGLDKVVTAVRKYDPNANGTITSQKDMAIIAERALENGQTDVAQFFATFALDSKAFDQLKALEDGPNSNVSVMDIAKLAYVGGVPTDISKASFDKAGIAFTPTSFTKSDLDKAVGIRPTTSGSTPADIETQLLQLLLILLQQQLTQPPVQQYPSYPMPIPYPTMPYPYPSPIPIAYS